MKKRLISMMLVATGMAFLLAGCGSGGTDSAAANGGSSEAEESGGSGDMITLENSQILQMGTGGSGGSLYYAGAAIQTGVSENFSNLTVTAQSTTGSVENLRRIEAGDLQLALTDPNSIVSEIEEGNISAENICLLGCSWDNPWFLVGNSDLPQTLSEGLTASSRVGAGEPGSSIQMQMSQVCQVLGLDLDDMDKEDISMSEEQTAIIDGRIDVGFFGGVTPNSSIEQVAAQVNGGVHILSWTDEQIAALQEINPFVYAYTVEAGSYTGQDYDAQIPSYHLPLVVAASVDEETVYQLTKYLYTHAEDLGKIYPACAEYVPENALQNLEAYEEAGIQVHPGAARYYQEIGIME